MTLTLAGMMKKFKNMRSRHIKAKGSRVVLSFNQKSVTDMD